MPIADANNFIVIYPQGFPMNTTLASSSSHWNVGGWTIGSNVKDVEFIDVIIDLVQKKVFLFCLLSMDMEVQLETISLIPTICQLQMQIILLLYIHKVFL